MADPPPSPPAPPMPRVMVGLYVMVVGRLVRELAGYLWDKGWRAGHAAGAAGRPVMCPAHPDMELETCPWACFSPPAFGGKGVAHTEVVTEPEDLFAPRGPAAEEHRPAGDHPGGVKGPPLYLPPDD